jgi:hypothetical protein
MGEGAGDQVAEPMSEPWKSESAPPDELPTEENPRFGLVCYYSVPISSAVRWVDDHGTHVVRSDEFDVYGEGDSLREALEDFLGHAEALFDQVADVVKAEDATDRELAIGALLGRRLNDAYRSELAMLGSDNLFHALLQAFALSFRRRRGQHAEVIWHPKPRSTTEHALPV